MAYTQRYTYDIFISYARSDNDGDLITDFKNELKKQFLLETTKNLEFFHDLENFTDIGELPPLLRANVKKSALFMMFLSQNYIQSKFCESEFKSFFEEDKSCKRVIGIMVDDLKDDFLKKIRYFPLKSKTFADNSNFEMLCKAILKSFDRIERFDRIIYFPQPNKMGKRKDYYLEIKHILEDQEYYVESIEDYNWSESATIESIMNDSNYYVQFFDSADIDNQEKIQFYYAIKNQFASMKILYIYSQGLVRDIKKKLIEGYKGDKEKLSVWIKERKNNLDFIPIPLSTKSQAFQKEIKELLVEKNNIKNPDVQNIVKQKNNLFDLQENIVLAEEGSSSYWLNELQRIVNMPDAPNFILYANNRATISNISLVN